MVRVLLALSLFLPMWTLRADDAPQAQQALPAAAEAVKKQYDDLIDYLKTESSPDVAEVGKRADSIKNDAEKVAADTTISDEVKQQVYAYALSGYMMASSLDIATYFPKFKALTADIKAKFPGSDIAAAGDAVIFRSEMEKLDPAAFLVRLTDYAKVYPKSDYGPALLTMYVDALKEADLPAAKQLVDDALKLYPSNSDLTEYRESLNLVGKPATLTGPALDGSVFDLSAWKGKVVVIDFWATWCGPCKAMTPKLLKLHSDLNSKGVEIVGVSLDNSQDDLEQYVAAHKIPWTILYFGSVRKRQDVAKHFGVSAIPTLFVVGKDGNFASFGMHDIRKVEAAVEAALKK